MRKKNYVILYTYYELTLNGNLNRYTGKVDMIALDKEIAEKIFYELNQPYILGYKNEEPIYNVKGGYVCECVLTYQEWLDEGSPESLD